MSVRVVRPCLDHESERLCEGWPVFRKQPPITAFVAAALDAAFEQSPFDAGHTGERWHGAADPSEQSWPSGPGDVLWCASYDELQSAHPGLPQSHDQENEPVRCVDFKLEFDQRGTLVLADLEDYSLAETFRMLGMDHEAEVAAGLIGGTAKDVCQVLSSLIATLLERTT
ncbi:hypothetical protein GCM10009844_43310 [Nocardioides koreensis]|uniref:Uncharacterized protein n=1 Tax=Nocardioides koreensis TaxID=433651 RepID=A0ABN3A7R9_9ACTN